MKKLGIAILTIVYIFLNIGYVYAQTVEGLRLKRNYRYDNLDKIINAIGEDLNIRFIYDREHLHRYKTSFDPTMSDSKEKTLGEVLKVLKNSWDMSILVGDDGYI